MTRQDRRWEGEKKPQTGPGTAEAVRCPRMPVAEPGCWAQIPAVPPAGTAILILNPAMDF